MVGDPGWLRAAGKHFLAHRWRNEDFTKERFKDRPEPNVEAGDERTCIAHDGFDHGIGHFMLFEVDSEARAPAPPMPKSPRTLSAASDRKSVLLPSSRPA